MLVPAGESLSSEEATREERIGEVPVLTTSGKECKFPFRLRGRLHHQCITFLLGRPWCSLTHNFDRDRQLGFCQPKNTQPDVSVHTSRRVSDVCQTNPCQNGGVCVQVPHSSSTQCSCPQSFTGSLCQHKRCYERLHLRYYDNGESWGRIHLRSVEQCTCLTGEVQCRRVRYTVCSSNPCQNDGSCRLITDTGEEVCNCRGDYSGPHCTLEPETECFTSRGLTYRGVVDTTTSGATCLPWNSDLLYDEFHVGTVNASQLRGLGKHAFCRNPDGDNSPWCYTLSDSAISWEYCNIPSCQMPLTSSRRIIPLNTLGTKDPRPSRQRKKKPVCGKKHKKRVSVARARILGGSSALPGSHPWMAAIYIGQSDFCAGTLISSCWVVSAAHCFFRNPLKSQLRVVLGQQHFNVSGPNTKTFGVDQYIFPDKFSVFNPTLHDIVLVRLQKQDGRCARRSPFIQPICLPHSNMSFPDNYCCIISGWGHMHEKAEGYSTLQEGGVRLISQDSCRKPEVYGNHVTADMLCAGLNGCVDACQGDSGGPLACSRGDVSFLYGVISWGEGCGRSGKPGVYTRVLNYLDWIHSVIHRKSTAS